MSRPTAYAFSFAGLDGGNLTLAGHAGKPILIVNTASQCGYTPQLAGLQQLWTRYRDRGLLIIGVPSNDFGGQEPGGPAEINKTAHGEYGVSFPLAAKADVKGPSAHPFYKWAAHETSRRTAALEFSQVPDRPRRPACRRVSDPDRADRPAGDRGHRERAGVGLPGAVRSASDNRSNGPDRTALC